MNKDMSSIQELRASFNKSAKEYRSLWGQNDAIAPSWSTIQKMVKPVLVENMRAIALVKQQNIHNDLTFHRETREVLKEKDVKLRPSKNYAHHRDLLKDNVKLAQKLEANRDVKTWTEKHTELKTHAKEIGVSYRQNYTKTSKQEYHRLDKKIEKLPRTTVVLTFKVLRVKGYTGVGISQLRTFGPNQSYNAMDSFKREFTKQDIDKVIRDGHQFNHDIAFETLYLEGVIDTPGAMRKAVEAKIQELINNEYYVRVEVFDVDYHKPVNMGAGKLNVNKIPMRAGDPIETVSYTHLTLPTNREV